MFVRDENLESKTEDLTNLNKKICHVLNIHTLNGSVLGGLAGSLVGGLVGYLLAEDSGAIPASIGCMLPGFYYGAKKNFNNGKKRIKKIVKETLPEYEQHVNNYLPNLKFQFIDTEK